LSPRKGEFAFFFLRNFLTQKASGFCKAQDNSLTFGSLKILLRKRNSQPLLFAKISKVIKNRTFPFGDVKEFWSVKRKFDFGILDFGL
jgi:hypothetical protein